MLVTDKFVFLHLPRAGGTFIYDVVKRFFPSAREIGYHLPRQLLPAEYSHLPIIGAIRNPWEFYASWYCHQYSNKRYSPLKNMLFGHLSGDRKLDIGQTIRNALELGVDDHKLDQLIQALPEHVNYEERHVPNLTKDMMRQIRGTGLGLFSFRFHQLFGHGHDVFFCRLESLRNDLIRFFESIGVANDELRTYVLTLDRKNSSDHRHYSTYYTPELAELVKIRDRQLVERFGFTFETRQFERELGLSEHKTPELAAPLVPSRESQTYVWAAQAKQLKTRESSNTEPRQVAHAYGKIILSGNTANRFGKRALAAPVDLHITAIWDKSDSIQQGLRISWAGEGEHDIWSSTVRKIIKLIEAQTGPLSGKLTIRNTLPLGRGMGSSTAIVIALSRCFMGQECKDAALAIEDVINRGHSGLDFAVIWEGRPVVIEGNKYELTELPKGLQQGYLFDTGIPDAPTPLIVQSLKERLTREQDLMKSVATIGDCTERLLAGEDPLTVFPDHYRAQVNLGVLPPRVRSLIERIERSGGAAKAARFGGIGGGAGMVFMVHRDTNALKTVLGSDPIALNYDPLLGQFIAVEPPVQNQPVRFIEPAELNI
jgi:mevalonate kinase